MKIYEGMLAHPHVGPQLAKRPRVLSTIHANRALCLDALKQPASAVAAVEDAVRQAELAAAAGEGPAARREPAAATPHGGSEKAKPSSEKSLSSARVLSAHVW